MWKDTEVARRLGLAAPIVQGPFGSGLSSVDLVVAVSESGGLGSFGVHHLDGAGIRKVAGEIRARTQRPFALNLWIPLGDSDDPQLSDARWNAACELLRPYFSELDRAHAGASGALRAPLRGAGRDGAGAEAAGVQFRIRRADRPRCSIAADRDGIVTIGAATTPAEAKLLADAGVDMIVATGFEAGGHRVSFLTEPEDCLTGTLSLVPQVVDAVKVPVIAAGGMADGRGIAAALKLGASAVQIGTAFLACEESNAAPLHRARYCSVHARAVSCARRAFTGRLARSIHNELHRCDARQGSGFRTVSSARLVDRATARRGARGWQGGSDFVVVGAGRAAAQASTRARVVCFACGGG